MKKPKLPAGGAVENRFQLPIDGYDIMIFAGCIGVLAGIWLIYHPAAYIIGGLGLIYLGLIGAKPKNKAGE